jgi:hypothetical protein
MNHIMGHETGANEAPVFILTNRWGYISISDLPTYVFSHLPPPPSLNYTALND